MRYLLNSTLLIDHAIGDPAAVDTLRGLFDAGDELFTCDVVMCETLSGAGEEDRRHLEGLLDALEFVATSPAAARWAGEARRARHLAGAKQAVGDALIGGVSMELGAIVVTRNVRDFARLGVPTLDY